MRRSPDLAAAPTAGLPRGQLVGGDSWRPSVKRSAGRRPAHSAVSIRARRRSPDLAVAPTAGLPKGSRSVEVAGSPDLYPFTGRCVPPAAQCCRPRHRVSRSTPTAQSKRQARSTYVRDHVFAADLGVDLFRPFQLEVGTHFENALLTVDQLLDRGCSATRPIPSPPPTTSSRRSPWSCATTRRRSGPWPPTALPPAPPSR